MRCIAILAAAITLVGTPAASAESAAVEIGPGAHTCGEFANFYAIDPATAELLTFTWAQGFMTAENIAIAATGGKTVRDLGASIDGQKAILRAFCNAHPLALYSEAVNDLYRRLPLTPLVSN